MTDGKWVVHITGLEDFPGDDTFYLDTEEHAVATAKDLARQFQKPVEVFVVRQVYLFNPPAFPEGKR